MNCQSHLARLFLATRREAASELKTADKERRPAGFLLGGTQRSFMRLVMVVQFHQIRAEISSALKNKVNGDFTSSALLWSTVGPSEELLGQLRLHYGSPLVGTKSALLTHTEVKSEGRSFCYSHRVGSPWRSVPVHKPVYTGKTLEPAPETMLQWHVGERSTPSTCCVPVDWHGDAINSYLISIDQMFSLFHSSSPSSLNLPCDSSVLTSVVMQRNSRWQCAPI